MKLNELNEPINEARGDFGDYDVHLSVSSDELILWIMNLPQIHIPTPYKEEIDDFIRDLIQEKATSKEYTEYLNKNLRFGILRKLHTGKKERRHELDTKADELTQTYLELLKSLAIEYVTKERQELNNLVRELKQAANIEDIVAISNRYGLTEE